MTQIIKLNVGGVPYMTSLSTLTQYRDSMLGAMVEQEHERNLIKEGKELFIDRNGQIFEYVLEYLRYADDVILPEDVSTLRKLLLDAEFYSLGDLTALISNKLEGLMEKPKWKVGDMISMGYLTYPYQLPAQIEELKKCGHLIGDLVGTIMEINAQNVMVKFTGFFTPTRNSAINKFSELSVFCVLERSRLNDKPMPSN